MKAPPEITFRRKQVDAGEPRGRFLSEVAELGGKLGAILAQLPPSLSYGDIVCESRRIFGFEASVAMRGCRNFGSSASRRTRTPRAAQNRSTQGRNSTSSDQALRGCRNTST